MITLYASILLLFLKRYGTMYDTGTWYVDVSEGIFVLYIYFAPMFLSSNEQEPRVFFLIPDEVIEQNDP
jgi:hypothetical protein